jgi:hypothetical protein
VSGHARDALAQRIEAASSGVALRAKEPLSDELRQTLARDEEQLRKLTVLDFDERSSVGALGSTGRSLLGWTIPSVQAD